VEKCKWGKTKALADSIINIQPPTESFNEHVSLFTSLISIQQVKCFKETRWCWWQSTM